MTRVLLPAILALTFVAKAQTHPKFRFGIGAVGNALETTDFRFGAQADLVYQLSSVLAFGAEVRLIDEHLFQAISSDEDFGQLDISRRLHQQAIQMGVLGKYYLRRQGKYRPYGSLSVGYQRQINLQTGPFSDKEYQQASNHLRAFLPENEGIYSAAQLGLDIRMNNRTTFRLGARYTLAPQLFGIHAIRFNLISDNQGGYYQLSAYEIRSYSPISFHLGFNFKFF